MKTTKDGSYYTTPEELLKSPTVQALIAELAEMDINRDGQLVHRKRRNLYTFSGHV